ncbi:unnamed protein product [Parnassius apollo]|uniref:(apollo) hypothetical protein n=1 Tax=Parnassius apollo TaxID=110799 RepID=A0A8S3X7E1_PARAO|nr:unnamed protein product [Parnassius apollo]
MLLIGIILLRAVLAHNITCEEIVASGKKLSLKELQSTDISQIINCLLHIGSEEMPRDESDFIWQSIVKNFRGVSNVPEEVLKVLHWVTPAITAAEYANLTLSNIEVIENFGLDYNLSNDQLTAIAERVREDFADKEPEDYTFYDLTALRNILCAFNRSEIERIHPSAYKEASQNIGKLKCKPEVMKAFATLAVQKDAFGPPDKWNDAIVRVVGEVAKYLPKTIVDKLFYSPVKN